MSIARALLLYAAVVVGFPAPSALAQSY
ncbi:MAG: hypothetical protein K0R53_2905, partial [Burkholderiales bacterium]|nr:hypothetical protein [Burkholderiales bacterium]